MATLYLSLIHCNCGQDLINKVVVSTIYLQFIFCNKSSKNLATCWEKLSTLDILGGVNLYRDMYLVYMFICEWFTPLALIIWKRVHKPDGVAGLHSDPLWNRPVLLHFLCQLGLNSVRLVSSLEMKTLQLKYRYFADKPFKF